MNFLASDLHSTAADKLSVTLSAPGVSSLCLFADYDSDLLTIKQKKKAPKSLTFEETPFRDDLGDGIETPMSFAHSMEGTVRDNLTNTATGQILLLAMWTWDSGRRLFDMYPEFVSCNNTEGTNLEERPLHDWCSQDANNELFSFLCAFLPSKAQWSYTFVFRGTISLGLGPSLVRTNKINSDADKQERRAICNAIGKRIKNYSMGVGSSNKEEIVLPLYKKNKKPPPLSSLISTIVSGGAVLPNAQHGWCGFHKIDRNFTSNSEYKNVLDYEREKSILGHIEIDVIVRWMWYFIKTYRTMEEVQMSAYFINWYMTENDQTYHISSLDDGSRTKIWYFLCKSFFPNSDMLFESSFDGVTFKKVTTSICEAWHRATKRVAGGPKPNHDIGESSKRINRLTEQN